RAVDHGDVVEGPIIKSRAHVDGVRSLVHNTRQTESGVWKRSGRLAAAGRIAGVACRTIEYRQCCIDEVCHVHAVVRVIDRQAVAICRRRRGRLAAPGCVRAVAGSCVEKRNWPLGCVTDMERMVSGIQNYVGCLPLSSLKVAPGTVTTAGVW